MTPPTPSYLGLNTSLYHTLDPNQINLLERTIWLRRVGRFQEALRIYENDLAELSDTPVIIIEHGSLYLEIREYGKLFRLVEASLTAKASDQATLDLPEWRLVAIMKAVVSVRHTGLLEPAVAEVVRMQRWLKDVPVAQYTDVQVNCAWRYILAYIFVKHSASYNEPTWELIPKPKNGMEPWQGLVDLRHSLLERGMARHANGLFKVEINRTKLTARLAKWTEFEVVPSLLSDARYRAHAQADLHLRRCDDYMSLHQLEKAAQEAAACRKALDLMLTLPGVEPGDDLHSRLHLAVICLSLVDNLADRLADAEDLLVKLRESGHPNYSTCLDLAAETAKAIYENTGSTAHLTKFYNMRRRHEVLDELEHEDLVSLVGHQYDIFGPAVHDKVDSQKCLEWIDGFFSKYPKFAAPTSMASLYTHQGVLLQGLQRLDEAKAAHNKAQYWYARSGNVTKLYHQSYSNILTPGQGQVGNAEYDPEDDEYGFSFERDGITALEDKTTGAKVVAHTILDFAFEDLRHQRLSVPDLERLLGFDKEDQEAVLSGGDALLAQLKESDAATLFALMFLPKSTYTPVDQYEMTPEEEMVEATVLDRRWEALSNWLSHPPKGQRNRRLFMLLLLLEVRKQWLSDSKLYDLRIKDFNRLLELQTALPRMLREFFESWRGGWHSAKAWLHYTKFLFSGNMDRGWPQVLEAEQCVMSAIHALRDSRQVLATAIMQRLLAMLSLLKIRRLAQGKDPSCEDEPHTLDEGALTSRIGDIRQKGLDAIMDADRIFSAGELEATWEDGAEGIQKRTQVSQTQQSYLTMQVASQLVLHDPDTPLNDEDTHLLWNFVQKYKARSLARAIGLFRTSPPGLVDRIIQSPSGESYQKMVSLQKSIDEAGTKDRFHLRREMDALRASMRKDPALRQLIDLREGTAFQLDELDALAEQIDQPFAVVEWFWVPPYFNNPPSSMGKGSIVLLTARPGRVVTVDVLDTDPLDLDRWIKECMKAKNARGKSILGDMIAYSQLNRYCGSLIAPLAKRTTSGEVLVLCPTYEINQLPLHALLIDKVPLIKRNPVVYIHALSLLRSCHSAAQFAADSKRGLQPLVFSGIAASPNKYFKGGRQSVVDIAARLGVKPLMDETALKQELLERATTSRLLHLHTHCNWDASDPLEHSLEFPNLQDMLETPDQADSKDLLANLSSSRVLTAREIFSLHLQQGSHVNLIACSGGVTDIKVGDEPTGLVPALLYSGSSSTVSTLWPIEDRDGARFARAFFDSLLTSHRGKSSLAGDEQQTRSGAERDVSKKQDGSDSTSHSNGMCWIDLAKVFQSAVLALGPDATEPMLSWAGFVFHGFWMTPISTTDLRATG